ncbi:MAG: alcohol dehydrogenase [Chloroflexota bacterium]
MDTPARFRIPRVVLSGCGAAAQIDQLAAELNARSVLVVTDGRLVESGTVEPVLTSLRAAGLPLAIYGGVTSEPTLRHVDEALTMVRDHRADTVIGVGGGSAIDAAKATAIMAEHDGVLPDYEGYDRFPKSGLPVIAVPTTAGTGSEVTRVAVVIDERRRVKMMLASDRLLPAAAVVDPLLTLGCPPSVTASSGIDALSHAIEAYVSRRAQPLTDALALSACRLIAPHLPIAHRNGSDVAARSKVMDGALQAGMAFSNSSVALVHGMSRPLGAVFGIPHGLANAMLLGPVMRFSLAGAVGRYADLADALGAPSTATSVEARATAAVDAVIALVAELGIPRIRDFGVERSAFERELHKMADDAIASGSPANNPIVPTHDEIVRLYIESY